METVTLLVGKDAVKVRNLGNDTKVPGEFDAQRARRILDAIRKKLGETGRPKLELDYLDRLLPTR